MRSTRSLWNKHARIHTTSPSESTRPARTSPLGLALLMGALLVSCNGGDRSSSPSGALKTALASADLLERARLVEAALRDAGADEIAPILDVFEEDRLRLDVVSASLLAIWWTRIDPDAALSTGLERHFIDGPTWASVVVREWGRVAPDRAADAVRVAFSEQDGPNWHRTLSLALVSGWLDSSTVDHDALMDFIRALPPGRPQKEALDLALGRMFRDRGARFAIAKVEALPDLDRLGHDPLKHDAFNRLATRLAVEDPQLAIGWASKHENGPFGHDLESRIARRWAREDPRSAMDWIVSRLESTGLDVAHADRRRNLVRTIGAVARVWTFGDPIGMRVWLEGRPLTEPIVPAFQASVLHEVRRGEPREAIARIEARTDGPLRDDLLIEAGSAWVQRDPARAERWLEEGHVSSRVAAKIRSGELARPRAPRRNPAS